MRPDRGSLERLAHALRHRGPDGTDIKVTDNVGLVRTRLAGELEDDGSPEPVLLDLAGQELVLARDRLGRRPLHWAEHDGAVWFASEIQALLEAGVPRAANAQSLTKVLSLGWDARAQTLIAGINRIMPGALLSIDLSSLRCSAKRWYDLVDEVDHDLQGELAAQSRNELRDLLDADLDRAVSRQLAGDAPIGVYCSGGIDSSLIAALAQRHRPGTPVFLAALQDGGPNEEPYARLLARRLGIELEVVNITAERWRAALVESVFHHGVPMAVPVGVGLSVLSQAASQSGFRAVLAGDAADALFGGDWSRHGQAFHEFLPRSQLLRRRLRVLRMQGVRRSAAALARRAVGTSPPRAAWVDLSGDWDWEDETTMRAVRAYGGDGPRARLAGGMLSDLSLNLTHGLVRVDGNAMQNGIDVRLPFLNPEVLRLTVNLPLEARVAGRPKGILSEVGARHLPRPIVRRPKVGGLLMTSNRWITDAARPAFLRAGMLPELLEIDAARWLECIAAAPQDQLFTLWTAEVWARLAVAGRSVSEVETDLWRW
jgi:asparagine synthase (glutamine-hydrolysing)